MPKRNNYKGGKSNYGQGFEGSKHDGGHQFYSEHDIRTDTTRRVSFKGHLRQGKNKGHKIKDWEQTIRAHLQDDDIDMGNVPSSSTGRVAVVRRLLNPQNNRNHQRVHSPAPRSGPNANKPGKRKLMEGPSNWYKVFLPFGAKYEKPYLIKMLQNFIAPEILIPITWRTEGVESCFFVDDFKIADKLFNADRQIAMPDGYKLIIRVRHNIPQIEINANLKEKMKVAMAKRYNGVTKALDLTKFHIDPELQDVFCALFRPIIMLTAIEIISENIPELEALNLNDNRLHLIEHLKCLSKKLPNLKILHLGNNKDGVDLPPPIVFDVVEEIKLPSTIQTFLCNEVGGDVVRTFLEQYFLIYDSESRQPLLQAYHETAMFSMTMTYPFGLTSKNSAPLNWYQADNRNLYRVQDTDRRHKLLRQGQLSVVSFLSEMPKTQHDMNSFKVDLSFFTPQLLMLNVTGLFKEGGSGLKVRPIRAFNRVLIIVAAGSGFCIVNEQLHVTNATQEEEREAFKNPVLIASPTPTSPIAGGVQPNVPDDITKQQMIEALKQQSSMNLSFTTRCLEETNWDYQRAVVVFTELHKQGSIPAEAFVQ